MKPVRSAAWRERVQRWMLRGRAPESLPVVLRQRRIYVLPTPAGLSFAALLLAMLVASLNYNLALGFALTFLLAGVGHLALLRAHRNLLGLQLQAARADPAFAGTSVQVELIFGEHSGRARGPTRVGIPADPATEFALEAGAPARVVCVLPARARGLGQVGRLRIETCFPLGLIVAWAYVEPDVAVWVYPRPESAPPPLPGGGAGQAEARGRGRAGDTELEALRPYRPGDSPRRIAWRRLSRGGPPVSKTFSDPASGHVSLDWQSTAALGEVEARLSRLCAWILAAESLGRRWSLSVPGLQLPQAQGAEHARRGLEALAAFGTTK